MPRLDHPLMKNQQLCQRTNQETTCPVICCKYCRNMSKSSKAYSSFLERPIKTKISCRISCLTPNVVYVITCLKCFFQYVGETKRELRRRIYEHLRSIEKFGQPNIQSTPVSEHFNLHCQKPAHLNFQVVEVINKDPKIENTTTLRRKRESWWILTLRTLDPLLIHLVAITLLI